MAIIKIVQEAHDFAYNTGFKSTNANFVDLNRVDSGWGFFEAGFAITWPEPAGNDMWFHYRFGTNESNVSWDEIDLFEFVDAEGSTVMLFDQYDGKWRFRLIGDTTDSWEESIVANVGSIWDVRVQRNGTTDLTVTIYRDEVLKDTLTVGNTVDKGMPVAWECYLNDNSASRESIYINEIILADEDPRGWRLYQHSVDEFSDNTDWTGDIEAYTNESLVSGLESNTNGDRQSFTLNKLDDIGVSDTIDRVVVQSYAIRGSTGLSKMNHFFTYEKDPLSDVTLDDSDLTLTTNLDVYVDEYATSPDTGVAWTQAEMQDMRVGIRART